MIKHVLVSCGRKMGIDILPNLQCKSKGQHCLGQTFPPSSLVHIWYTELSTNKRGKNTNLDKILGLNHFSSILVKFVTESNSLHFCKIMGIYMFLSKYIVFFMLRPVSVLLQEASRICLGSFGAAGLNLGRYRAGFSLPRAKLKHKS